MNQIKLESLGRKSKIISDNPYKLIIYNCIMKSNKHWLVNLPLFGISTQALKEENIPEMVKDCLELVIHSQLLISSKDAQMKYSVSCDNETDIVIESNNEEATKVLDRLVKHHRRN